MHEASSISACVCILSNSSERGVRRSRLHLREQIEVLAQVAIAIRMIDVGVFEPVGTLYCRQPVVELSGLAYRRR